MRSITAGVWYTLGKRPKKQLRASEIFGDGSTSTSEKLTAENISLAEMRCRYLTFESDWWVIAAELAIIQHYEPEWNESGFGSKNPGAGRP